MEKPKGQEKGELVERLLAQPEVIALAKRVDTIGFINNPFTISYIHEMDNTPLEYPDSIRGIAVYTQTIPADNNTYYKYIALTHEQGDQKRPLTLTQIEKPTRFDLRRNEFIARTVTPEFLNSKECLLYGESATKIIARFWHYIYAADVLVKNIERLPEATEHLPRWASGSPTFVLRDINTVEGLFPKWPQYIEERHSYLSPVIPEVTV